MTHQDGLRFGIGARAPRVEDRRFLTGRGRYGDDINIEGQAYAEFVLSQAPSGRILSIDTDAAHDEPGVIGVYTAADLEATGFGPLPCFATRAAPLMRVDGAPAFVPPRPALAQNAVRFVGDILAVVVAETPDAARRGAEAVLPEIEDASFVLTPVDAATTGAPAVWDACPDNTSYVFRAGDFDAVDAAIAEAPHVAHVDIPFTRLAMTPMEPRSALGVFDPADGRYTLHCGTQNPHLVRRALAQDVLRVPETDVRIVTPDMGGAFGMRSTVFPEMAAVLWAARTLGRPIKWTGTRSAAFLNDDMGRDLHMSAELALEADGAFRALRVRSIAALGAYLSLFGPIPTFSNIGGLAGVYRTPLISADVRAVFTNLPPLAPYRGAGRPEAIACIELAIDEAARKFGFDRFELRRKNMIAPSDMPFRTGLTFTYDSGDFPKSMDMAVKAADVAGFESRRVESRARGQLRGLGLVNAIESSAGAMDEGAELRVEWDGSATLLIGSVNHGQGHETTLRQVVAEHLPLPFERIRLRANDTDAVAYGRGSFASRTAVLGGSAAMQAAQSILSQARDIAAHILGADPDEIEQEHDVFRQRGTNKSLRWDEITRAAHTPQALPLGRRAGLSASVTFNADHGPTFPNGCHICEVEIEIETGLPKVIRYVVVDDVGTVLNPQIVEGQIHGGVVQGLSQVLGECMVYDRDTGQPLTGSFMDYTMPRAADVPNFELLHNPNPTAKNPLGAKGAGEAGTVGALPAALAAVHDALAPLGIERVEMPATPARLWTLIDAALSGTH